MDYIDRIYKYVTEQLTPDKVITVSNISENPADFVAGLKHLMDGRYVTDIEFIKNDYKQFRKIAAWKQHLKKKK